MRIIDKLTQEEMTTMPNDITVLDVWKRAIAHEQLDVCPNGGCKNAHDRNAECIVMLHARGEIMLTYRNLCHLDFDFTE